MQIQILASDKEYTQLKKGLQSSKGNTRNPLFRSLRGPPARVKRKET
jgi:hypothetical protein